MAVEAVLGWALPAILFLLALILLYLYGTWTYKTWGQQGIPGPKPTPFLGNIKEFQKKGPLNALIEWQAQYGQLYGFYQFRKPFLVTSDVDMIKEITIKDFNHFMERGFNFPLTRRPFTRNLVNVSSEEWRRQRHTLTPTFSAAKLKQMSRFISRCCDNLLTSMTKMAENGQPIDVKKVFGSYTLDVIAGTGFGMETNSLETADNNAFLDAVIKVFSKFGQPNIPVILASIFPMLEPVLLLLGFENITEWRSRQFLQDTIQHVMDDRKTSSQTHVDILQLMLNAEATEEYVKDNPTDKCLTREEILAQGLVLFATGYETTASTLQYMSYLLALNQDAQDKLHQEVVKAIGDEELSYENVSKISYLDSCIYETLRIFPPTFAFSRIAGETRTIKGITIPAGCGVTFSVCTIMRDEAYFPEPTKFMPDRYEEGGCSSHVPTMVKELPFGCGPRQCIGMRLALYEARMAMAGLVRKVKFTKIPQTAEKITLSANLLSTPTTPILVGLEPRK